MTPWIEFGMARTSRVISVAGAIAVLALSTFAIAPASAQGSGSWTLDCKGDAMGGVSWTWLSNGTPISGATGSGGCSGTVTLTGTSAAPASANGLTAAVFASAGDKTSTNTVTMSFDPAKSFQLQLSASASDRFCLRFPRTCTWDTDHEDAQFSLQG